MAGNMLALSMSGWDNDIGPTLSQLLDICWPDEQHYVGPTSFANDGQPNANVGPTIDCYLGSSKT